MLGTFFNCSPFYLLPIYLFIYFRQGPSLNPEFMGLARLVGQ